MNSRREFLRQSSAFACTLVLPWQLPFPGDNTTKLKPLSFGIVADAHQDIMHDTEARLEDFLSVADSKGLDFIIQIGDFCHPIAKNKPFLALWDQYPGPKYHVLGNHEMDLGSKQDNIDFLGMSGRYYSFDAQGCHFIVLDANNLYIDEAFVHYDNANFYNHPDARTWIDDEQLEWLKGDLQATENSCVIISHQSLENNLWGVKNRVVLQKIFEEENARAGYQKVIACFNGHNHIDYHRQVNGIHYIDINSMSYQWLGANYELKTRYKDQSLYEQYPHLSKVAPYKEALYAFVTIDPGGTLTVSGRSSSWVGPSPQEMGYDMKALSGYDLTPHISDLGLRF